MVIGNFRSPNSKLPVSSLHSYYAFWGVRNKMAASPIARASWDLSLSNLDSRVRAYLMHDI